MCTFLFILYEGTICYDGCHLRRYASNTARCDLTATARRLASLNIVVDRMHFKGHTDPWCHEHCDPNKLKELEKVSIGNSITPEANMGMRNLLNASSLILPMGLLVFCTGQHGGL